MTKNRITSLLHDILGIFYRFPVSISSIILLTALSITSTQLQNDKILSRETSCALIVGLIVLTLLSYGTKLYSENNKSQNPGKLYLLYSLSVLYPLFSGIFCFYQYNHPFIDYYIFIFPLTSLLIIAVLPFYGKNNPDALWNYIIQLTTSAIVALLYSVITFGGLALICAAIDLLFGSHILKPEILASIVFLFFAPVQILAFTPKSFNKYKTVPSYPIIGKILVQYILFVLILIYGSVLYAYAIKIFITWSLPQGVVSYMIITFALLGTILWYLLYPNTQNNHRLHIFYKKYFYHLLLPLLALLFIALFRRTGEYGLTTNRYIVILSGTWFVIISLYAIFRKITNIIPIITTSTLFILLFSFGPWSIFELPKKCQFNDFEKYAAEQGLIRDGKLTNSNNQLTKEQNIIISGYLDFFIPDYKEEFAKRFYTTTAERSFIQPGYTRSEINQAIMQKLDGEYYSSYKRLDIKYGLDSPDKKIERISLYTKDNTIKEIQPYTYFFQYNDDSEDTLSLQIENHELKIIKDNLTNMLFIYPGTDTLSVNFSQIAANLYNKFPSNSYYIILQPEDSYITLTGKKINITIGLQHLSVPVNINDTGDAYPISGTTNTPEYNQEATYELNCFFSIK